MNDEYDEHRDKMVRRKEAHDRKLAAATEEKGLLVVTTGAGKGKTTAALGLVFRALGHGMRVGVVQFTKGAIATGEAALAQKLAPNWNGTRSARGSPGTPRTATATGTWPRPGARGASPCASSATRRSTSSWSTS